MNVQLNSYTIQQSFAGITLAHMSSEIDLGDVILRDGDQAAELTAVWLIQRFFWDHPIHKGNGIPTKSNLEDTLGQAKYMATNYLMNEWDQLGERAKIYILEDAQKTGWHTNKYFNYQNLEELLSSILDEQDTKKGVSVWSFLVKQLLPAAARYGVDPNLLYGAKSQVYKLKDLVPVARDILASDDSELVKERNLKYFIEKAADKTVSTRSFKSAADAFRGKQEKKIQQLAGYEMIMPNQETWIVVRCPSTRDERVVEMLLGQKVDLRVTDWRAFTGIIAGMLKDYGDLSLEDQHNLIPKLISILEGKTNGNSETPEGTAITWTANP